jgi:peptidyl-prolyl cis-trans isomerase C
MSCSSHAAIAAAPGSIVSVNGSLILHEAISQEAQNHPALSPVAAWTAAARALVLRELLLQRAAALGVVAEPDIDAQGRRETEDEALLRAVIDHDVRLPEADEATCRRYYDRNPDRFRSAEIMEVSHILIAARPHEKTEYQIAAQTAGDLLTAITSGRAAFSDIARHHSQCPSRLNGGSLGQITVGDTVAEFEDALLKLAPGELCAMPVATRYGFHIIRLDRRIASSIVPFDVVSDQIAGYLVDRVRRHALAQYAQVLVARADVRGIDLPAAAGPLMQ